MEEFSYQFKIPKERIAILIGKEGDIKRKVEEVTHTKINVDSKEGDVTITGTDGLQLYDAREVIRAIGRGFNPDIALQLLHVDTALEIIDIRDFSGKSINTLVRLKGRVIGKEGKSRHQIEKLTDTAISVYGKTIAIVGSVEDVAIARRAVESLLTGSPHSSVYTFLEKQRRIRRRRQFEAQDKSLWK